MIGMTMPSLAATLRRAFSLSNVAALAAFVVICAAGAYADHQDNALYEQTQRQKVLAQIGVVRAELEGNVKADVRLVQGLVATLVTEPDMSQERFSTLAANVLGNNSQIVELAAAPHLVVNYVYPLKGNEKALGLDYKTTPGQLDSVLAARDTGQTVLSGPVNLVQGGKAFIARVPVFVGYYKQFWGVISVIIGIDRLYGESGLLEAGQNVEISLGTPGGTPFFSSIGQAIEDPVSVQVAVPSGTWELLGAPKGGWATTSPNAWWLRLVIFAGDTVVLLPLIFARTVAKERQAHADELRRREVELERLSQRLDLALDASKVGVWDFDITANELVWDNRMNELYGLPMDGGPRSYVHWHDALHPDDLQRSEQEFNEAVNVTGRYRSQYRIITPAGVQRTIRATGAVYGDGVTTRKIVGANWDVSSDVALNEELTQARILAEARNVELESAHKRIEHIALHDALTGMPNRRYLDEVLAAHGSSANATTTPIALLHVDLDRFKEINDTLGHAAGDAMLIHASRVLMANVRPGDFVARIGGDEFVVLSLTGVNVARLEELAGRIIEDMRKPVAYDGIECRVGISVGIALQDAGAPDAKRLLVEADVALYHAKSQGRNRFEFFDDELRVRIGERKALADELLRAVERDEFVPYYQPQFDAHTLDVVGAEALVRWRHPERGLLTPDAFLNAAEELNVMAAIDRLVLERGLADLAIWDKSGVAVPRLSVNVSARRLRDDALVASLQALEIEPGRVSFELVESIYLDESDSAIAWNIDHIKELGIDIEIDDFGTGYASIVSLTKLSPKRLKIDRQLTSPVETSGAQRRLIASIVEIGKALGVEVVAEGVETMAQAALLRDLGCDILQGYALARPMPAEDILRFMRAETWRRAS